ncbi:hypothetical protein CKM354_000466900 [Cercospora kikuchii]|uniref:Uncharacterized protein n=1 Tax=Cercospora kikuchii TaxID=84275 RepID=A0A9P3CEL3_9PEZI|nr:uncharacterized protein CKM354_000466900 [Cercospora kikuchii]GIZ41363.1 hypothetical protein CKM354_000466900 [Cercospora kikuchii]
MALAGAAYSKYQQHKLQQQPQNERSMSQAMPPYTTDQPASQQAPFELSGEKSSLLHQEDKAPINPPSYDTVVVNRAIVPDNDPTAHMSPYESPTLMNRRDAGDASSSISSLDSSVATLAQEKDGRRISSIDIPEGTTWWQAYRARKAERGEAKRAEKAEWKAEKAQWRAARRMAKGRC